MDITVQIGICDFCKQNHSKQCIVDTDILVRRHHSDWLKDSAINDLVLTRDCFKAKHYPAYEMWLKHFKAPELVEQTCVVFSEPNTSEVTLCKKHIEFALKFGNKD